MMTGRTMHQRIPAAMLCASLAVSLLVPLLTQADRSARTTEQIYQAYCGACHATGWNGAPITGIRDDWESRLSAGADAMLENVKRGMNTMPPMGTCADCSDAELRAAIGMMTDF